jgi:hypothetical protein
MISFYVKLFGMIVSITDLRLFKIPNKRDFPSLCSNPMHQLRVLQRIMFKNRGFS